MAKKSRSFNESPPLNTPHALALLRFDHARVDKLFKEFERSGDPDEKQALANTICAELTVHTAIEEEIFYPAARAALDDLETLNTAAVEHASAKELIGQIVDGSPRDDLWEAKVLVLGEYIKHHVKEEEEDLFPRVKLSDMDLESLGEEMQARKDELTFKQSRGLDGSQDNRANA
jgi:hemerythrin superfamily protein